MDKSVESALRQANEELKSLYEGSAEGILVADADTQRFVRANRAICEMLGYSHDELLSLSVTDIHPEDTLADVEEIFKAMRDRRVMHAHNIACLRKDGRIVHVDVAGNYLGCGDRPMLVGFFRDITDQNQTIALLRASEERYRLITDNIGDVIWTVQLSFSDSEKAAANKDIAAMVDAILGSWRFSFVSPSATRLFGYTPDEITDLSLRDIATPASHGLIREALIEEFVAKPLGTRHGDQQHMLEAEFSAKDGSSRWCEIVSTYLRDADGLPTDILGVARDISQRRKAEHAMRESESTLRNLFENLPDVVLTVDRDSKIHFANRDMPGMKRESPGACLTNLIIPEHRPLYCSSLGQVFVGGPSKVVEVRDIWGRWWSARIVLSMREGDAEHATIICTDITQERLSAEAIDKEQQLLRQLLELHERERQLTAYEIHDGFAQQLTGSLFRLQAFRDTLARNPTEAWAGFDAAVRLISSAIDETRRLISGLRPPILDESGIVPAIEYLVYEHEMHDGPKIEFRHNVAFDRLAPPLESAVFRIVQESLHNACQHSHSEKVLIELRQRDDRIHIDIRDWGVGFCNATIDERRFGLQGIRERVRLLDGHIVIDSAPGKGTHIAVELPMVALPSGSSEAMGAVE